MITEQPPPITPGVHYVAGGRLRWVLAVGNGHVIYSRGGDAHLECQVETFLRWMKSGDHSRREAMANETPPHLAERNAEIVRLRAHGATYKELAQDFHVSTARISQILQKAGVQIKRYRRAHEGPSPAAEPAPPEEAS